jgi:hypothetical protein
MKEHSLVWLGTSSDGRTDGYRKKFLSSFFVRRNPVGHLRILIFETKTTGPARRQSSSILVSRKIYYCVPLCI